MKTKTKKMKGYGLGDLQAGALGIIVLVLFIATGSIILAQYASMTVVTDSANATYVMNQGQEALITFADWFPIIVVVISAVVIIGLVMLLQFRSDNRA